MTAPFLFPIAVQTQPAVGYTSGDLCAYHQFLDQTDMPRWQPDNPSAPSRQYTHLLAQPRVGSRSCRLPSVACFDPHRSDGGRHMQARSEEFRDHAAECSEIAKRHSGLINQQYEQIAGQWLFLAEHALIVRDPVLLCAAPLSCS